MLIDGRLINMLSYLSSVWRVNLKLPARERPHIWPFWCMEHTVGGRCLLGVNTKVSNQTVNLSRVKKYRSIVPTMSQRLSAVSGEGAHYCDGQNFQIGLRQFRESHILKGELRKTRSAFCVCVISPQILRFICRTLSKNAQPWTLPLSNFVSVDICPTRVVHSLP